MKKELLATSKQTLILLIQMTGQVVTCIVLMHKRPIHAGNRFKHILKTLGHIVAISKTHTLVQNNVDFDVQPIAAVVGL